MKLTRILNKINGGFASGNNNQFDNYTGNVAYYVDKKINKNNNKVFYFTCRNATFSINKDGYIIWSSGDWLDGQFYGSFNGGKFWNGKLNEMKIKQ